MEPRNLRGPVLILLVSILASAVAGVSASPGEVEDGKIVHSFEGSARSTLSPLIALSPDSSQGLPQDRKIGEIPEIQGSYREEKVVETVRGSKSIISSYGRDFEIVGSGSTPQRQEVIYRYQAPEKQGSYIAVSEGNYSIDIYAQKVEKTLSRGGRNVNLTREQPVNYREVAEVSDFGKAWKKEDGKLDRLKRSMAANPLVLPTSVIPGQANIYRVGSTPREDIYVRITSSSNITFLALDPAGAYAEYDPGFSAPYCSGYTSPCVANSSLLRSKDGMDPGEPNSPNTVDAASDGTTVTNGYQTEESVENITATDQDNPAFGGGDSVKVGAQVYCYDDTDDINFAYAPDAGSPAWQHIAQFDCPGTGGPYSFSTQVQTEERTGNHAFRVINDWQTGSTTEGTSEYADNDDLVVRFDNVPPNITLESPPNRSVISSGTPINLTVEDGQKNLNASFYSLDGGPNQSLGSPYDIQTSEWGQGTHTLEIYANDTAGNLKSKHYQFTVDDTAPALNIFDPLNRSYNRSTLDLNYTARDIHKDSVWYSIDGGPNNTLNGNTTVTYSEGNHVLRLYANDSAGNLNSANVSFEIDTLTPEITLDAPLNESKVEQGLAINFTVKDSNLDTVKYQLNYTENSTDFLGTYDINTSTWTQGINNLTLYANDTLGNSGSRFFQFNITKNQPPVIILDQPSNKSYVDGGSFLNYTVSDKDLDAVKYSIDEGLNSTDFLGSYDINLSISEEGPISVDYYANDSKGLLTHRYYTFTVDNKEPDLKLFSPENTTYNDHEVDLNYSSSDMSLGETFYSLNDASNVTLTGNTTITASEGTNTLKLYANDSAGHLASKDMVFSLDTTGPAISIESPKNITYFQDDVLANVTLDEPSSSCVYSLDAGENKSMGKDSDKQFSKLMTDLNYDHHNITFWCEDTESNWNSTEPLYFTTATPSPRYSPDLGTPYCPAGYSPCRINESLIISKDDLATDEPNSPNTVDGATDGTSGTYQNDESVDQINVTDNNASIFSSGHSITVSTKVYCWGTSDVVNILFANNTASPNWNVQYSQACGGEGFETHQTTFPWTGSGNVSVRSLIEYEGSSTTTSITSSYGDQDDVVIPLDNSPPAIELDSPSNGSVVKPGDILKYSINDREDHFSSASFTNGTGKNYTLNPPFHIDTSNWSEGVKPVKIWANDSAGNYNVNYYEFKVDGTSPKWSQLNQTRNGREASRIYTGREYNLSARWEDTNELGEAVLTSNETGVFKNNSLASRKTLSGTSDYSNYTVSLGDNQNNLIGWAMWADDLVENWNRTKTVISEIWEYVNVTWYSPESPTVNQGQAVELKCGVQKELDGEPAANYSVQFWVKNSTNTFYIGQNSTSNTGNATVTWDTKNYEPGTYEGMCNITENMTKQTTPITRKDNTSITVETANGKLNGTLEIPDGTTVAVDKYFDANATVECSSADCGEVSSTLRYNESGDADTAVGEGSGDPFYTDNNPKTCNLNQGDTCQLSWDVNASGSQDTTHALDVQFEGTTASSNDTIDKEVRIDYILVMDFDYTEINFPVGDPGQVVEAPGNSEGSYTATLSSDSNEADGGAWIRMSNLTLNDSNDINKTIEPERTSWTFKNTCSYTGSENMTSDYSEMLSQVDPGESFTQCFWHDIPYGKYEGNYTGTISLKVNATN